METLDSIKERLAFEERRLKKLHSDYATKPKGAIFQHSKGLIEESIARNRLKLESFGVVNLWLIKAKIIEKELLAPGKIIPSNLWKTTKYFISCALETDATTCFLNDVGEKYETDIIKVEKIISRKIIFP